MLSELLILLHLSEFVAVKFIGSQCLLVSDKVAPYLHVAGCQQLVTPDPLVNVYVRPKALPCCHELIHQ